MTILPAKRTAAQAEEPADPSQQNGNAERNVRRRDEIGALQIEGNSPSRRSPFSYKSPGERKERLRKHHYKEQDRRQREREREQKREARREQKRERKNAVEPLLESNSSAPADSVPSAAPPSANNNELALAHKEDCTGFNSEDEYDERIFKDRHLTDEDWQKKDEFFSRCMSNLGYEIKNINDDGACLFRSIADQVYGDQEFHHQVRQDCMNYIVQNRDHFEPYVTEDFDKYIARKRKWNVHGNSLEIQAMSELYNRTIELYCYQMEPINVFNCSRLINTYEPIRLSYHRMCHYNSISNPTKPSVGVGLGLPNYKTVDIDRRRFNDAIRASEELLIEQTMLEDKLKATDWEATNEAIEEQVARESYIQYFRDSEKRLKAQGHSSSGTSSTITSSMRGSVSPKNNNNNCPSPKAATSSTTRSSGCSSYSPPVVGSPPRGSPRAAAASGFGSAAGDQAMATPPVYVPTEEESAFAKRVYNSPRRIEPQEQQEFSQPGPSKSGFGMDVDVDQEIMAQVLAESQKTYLDELKHKSKKRHGSPGPSTST